MSSTLKYASAVAAFYSRSSSSWRVFKLGAVEATNYMAFKGVPTILFWPTVLLEIVGGIFVLIGFQTRILPWRWRPSPFSRAYSSMSPLQAWTRRPRKTK